MAETPAHRAITDDELRSAAILAVPDSWFDFSADWAHATEALDQFAADIKDRCAQLGTEAPLICLMPDPGELILLPESDEIRQLTELIRKKEQADG